MKRFFIICLLLGTTGLAGRYWLLPGMGHWLVEDAPAARADAAVVLQTGVDYYPRLMEAATLYHQGRVDTIAINGNRKTDILRQLESRGFRRAAPWDEDALRILEVLGVPRERVLSIPAEDVFDTISEARTLEPSLTANGLRRLIIVTSKFHTNRASRIWRQRAGGDFEISSAAARHDPFDPDHWWRSGRQIRQVMAEYGGWLFYLWSTWQAPT